MDGAFVGIYVGKTLLPNQLSLTAKMCYDFLGTSDQVLPMLSNTSVKICCFCVSFQSSTKPAA
jgi:hypothetical protein